MSNWSLYDDNGKVAEGMTETGARNALLDMDEDPTMYAMNETGDVIETHDGPITVARVKE